MNGFFSAPLVISAVFCHWSANSCFREFLIFEAVISVACGPFLPIMNNPNIDLAQLKNNQNQQLQQTQSLLILATHIQLLCLTDIA